jgi:RNA polymerase sigma factor (sigma-70 family)
VSADDPRTDAELVADANAGDAAAFEAIYLCHRDWVLRVACRFTHDQSEALDVLQETFLLLLRKFPGFELTSRMTTFLYPVIRHTALAPRRKSSRERQQAHREDLEHLPDRSAPQDKLIGDDLA